MSHDGTEMTTAAPPLYSAKYRNSSVRYRRKVPVKSTSSMSSRPTSTGRKRRRGSPIHEVATHGGKPLLFQNDNTGRKRINTSALRFVVDVIQDETGKAIASVASELMEASEKEEARRVQVRSRSHVTEIVAEVRRKMAEVKVPLRYVTVEDSLTAVDLEKKNALRRHDIETSEEVCTHLLEDLQEEKRKMKAAQARKDELLKQLMMDGGTEPSGDKDETSEEGKRSTVSPAGNIHPLLVKGYSKLMEKRRAEVETLGDGRKPSSSRAQKIKPLQPGKSIMRNLFTK